MSEMTPWFPAIVNPVRNGVYEVKRLCWDYPTGQFVRRWHKLEWRNNRTWHYTKNARMSYPGSLAAMVPGEGFWRGIASDPQRPQQEVDRHEDDTDNWW